MYQPRETLPPANVEIWVRQSVDELAKSATDVIRAEVLDSREEQINTILGGSTHGSQFVKPHLVYRLRVIEVFKGDTEVGDIVEIMQEKVQTDNIGTGHVRQLSIAIGADLVFFLRSFESQGSEHLPMAIEGGSQGVYRTPSSIVDNDSVRSIKETIDEDPSISDVTLSSLDTFNNMILTIGDLMRISGDSK